MVKFVVFMPNCVPHLVIIIIILHYYNPVSFPSINVALGIVYCITSGAQSTH